MQYSLEHFLAAKFSVVPIAHARHQRRVRQTARWILATIYWLAGIFHIVTPDTFLLITPDWVPFPNQVIFATGLCELAGAASLLIKQLRPLAGWALGLYAICVFPANIKHAVHGLPIGYVQLGWWYHIPRLAFQPVLVWWALFAAEIIDWPFKRIERGSP